MEVFAVLLYCLMLFFLLSYFVAIWCSGKISGKYYDDKTKELGYPLLIVPRVCCTRRCMRASCYLLYVLCGCNPLLSLYARCGRQAWVEGYYKYFGKINYRIYARKRDWVMAFILWGSFIMFIIAIIIMGIFPN
jgi:hypothetical protein